MRLNSDVTLAKQIAYDPVVATVAAGDARDVASLGKAVVFDPPFLASHRVP